MDSRFTDFQWQSQEGSAGTGLLSMMAARAMNSVVGDSKRMVTACESYLPMVKLMRKVLRLNGMERKVKVINKRSDELQFGADIASRADVLVSEILDSELLGEGLIPTLQHAHDKLLVEDPLTVPYRATIYGQLVESTYLWKLHDLHNNEAKASDGIHLVPVGLEPIICVKPQQYAMHCDAITNEVKLLSEPFKVFEFDFWKRPESHAENELHIKATESGRVHAVVSWWMLQLDREGTVFYSTAPKWISPPKNIRAGDWCDHWKQCVWFIPRNGASISKDEKVHLIASHNDTTFSYHLKTQIPRGEVLQHGINAENFKLIYPPERIAVYGDREWRLAMSLAITNASQGRALSVCMVADDSVFLTLLVASILKTTRVLSLFPGIREKGGKYLQVVACANGISADSIKVIEKRISCLTLYDTFEKKVDLLISEPFYYGNDSALPWHNLRFWKERTMLDSVLSDDVLIMPSRGILRGCIMSFPDLWNSRRRLGTIEGFYHSVANSTLGACGELPEGEEGPCLAFYIWQCGEYEELSEIFTLMEFDFSKPISPYSGKSQVKVTKAGICHGIALWIDWVMDPKNSIVISTGPDKRFWKQGVKLLANPVTVGARGSGEGRECCSAVIEASFDPSSGELDIRHTFLQCSEAFGPRAVTDDKTVTIGQ
ncbi:protein arginine N-methyltransferase 1.6 isoform X2 [Momordica charantia]|uniref:Protein arginine N-methyltransferase 1.6 isoform X2 n=1 Tax=Momordica charantia TaxID=3673 RepID=A0A6J1DLD2_MOMCH|nr:protein arginine N-methyltransferase 1.6 isoform X2 [Momordica charantia]